MEKALAELHLQTGMAMEEMLNLAGRLPGCVSLRVMMRY
jgi:hypothetical protein